MRSKIAIKGHPIHPLLVSLPIGLFLWTLVADIVYVRSNNPTWFAIAYWSSIGGIATALIAAIPGFADYFTLARYSRAKGMAKTHMILNLLLVCVFAIAVFVMQGIDPTVGDGFRTVLLLHGIGVMALAIAGWLGGEMVFRHRLAVVESADHMVQQSTLGVRAIRDDLTRRRFGG